MDEAQILEHLQSLAYPEAASGAAHFGIRPKTTYYGINLPVLRALAKQIGKDHALAGQLWNSGVHDARLLATMIAERKKLTEAQMDEWAASFDTWDICDQCCSNLFDKVPWAYQKVREWSSREEEFVKRAAFALMAVLAVHDKKADDEKFLEFLPLIQREATDERNFVKKAVNWALRQIGKRNVKLNQAALAVAQTLEGSDSKAAHWIGKDAVRELSSAVVQERLNK